MRQPNPNILPEAARSAWKKGRSSSGYDQTVTAHCELITPMYGGGVTAGKVDPALPIRASALRGQLRFWWRLLQCTGDDGEAFADSRKLFGVETDLWGGISSKGPQASKVEVRIEAKPIGPEELIAWKAGDGGKVNSRFPVYALVLEQKENPRLLKDRYPFQLTLGFTSKVASERRNQVIDALRWWASFSGVGARTRRGLGAVKVVSDDVELKPVSGNEVTSRGGWMILGQPTAKADIAWRNAVGTLQKFRQGPGAGRNPGRGNHPGRSRWPEPDAIRRLAKTHAPQHAPEHEVDGFYPRAAFGLPIVFQFKDKRSGDPHDHTLVPVEPGSDKKQDRMASPLILRPYFYGERYRPLALLLPGWKERISAPVGFEPGKEQPAWPNEPDERKRLAAHVLPMESRGEDVLTAFMRFFEAQLGSARSTSNQGPGGSRPRRAS